MYKSCFPLSGMLCSPNEKKQERRKKEERSSLPRFKSLIKPRDIFMVVWFIVRADIRNKSKGQFWLVLCHVLLVQTVNRIPCVKPGNLPRLAKKKKKKKSQAVRKIVYRPCKARLSSRLLQYRARSSNDLFVWIYRMIIERCNTAEFVGFSLQRFKRLARTQSRRELCRYIIDHWQFLWE